MQFWKELCFDGGFGQELIPLCWLFLQSTLLSPILEDQFELDMRSEKERDQLNWCQIQLSFTLGRAGGGVTRRGGTDEKPPAPEKD